MTSYCHTCRKLTQSWLRYSEGRVLLAKYCDECGHSEVQIESDWEFCLNQENLLRTYSQNDCYMIDITSKCDAGCRHCYNRDGDDVPTHELFDQILATPEGSRVLLSGGEPLQNPIFDKIARFTHDNKRFPVLLTNGAGLTFDNVKKLFLSGLYCTTSPQIAVSLGLPGTNNTFEQAYDNLKHIKVADIAFTVTSLDELSQVIELSESLRGHYEAICIRTAWDGVTKGLYLSEMVKQMDGDLLEAPTLHGYRNAMVEKNGIFYKLLSWPTWEQYDLERYKDRGVWYKGDNVVNTLVKNAATLPLS